MNITYLHGQNLDSSAVNGSSGNAQRNGESASTAAGLKQALEEARARHDTLDDQRQELQLALDERTIELDALKKKMNRDVTINGGVQDPTRNPSVTSPQSPPSKYDIATAREEIVGLKYDHLPCTVYIL